MTPEQAAAWVRAMAKVEPSPLGVRVAQLLDAWLDGLHHLPYGQVRKIDWADPRYISLTWYGSLDTFDFDRLTRLVVLCHDRCIRGEVRPCNMRYLRLSFTAREGRDGGMSRRHPTIESAIEQVRRGP